MPTLPTFDVTQAQSDRMMAAFSQPGDTQAQTVARYKEWLRGEIVFYVQQVELAKVKAQNKISETNVVNDVATALPPPNPVP